MNGKIDPRTEKTRNYLAESLLTLMKDKPLSRITVKDLCQQAGVNRTTFYAHYKDVKELLEEVESVLLSDIQKNLAAGLSSGSTMEDMLTNLLDTIKQNSDLCFILLGKNGDMEFLGKALYWAEEATLQSWQRAYPNRNSRDFTQLYRFLSAGAMAVIGDWVRGGMKEEVSDLARFIDRMTRLSSRSLVTDWK